MIRLFMTKTNGYPKPGIIVLIMLFLSTTFAQSNRLPDSLIVSEVNYVGNEVTRDFVIDREIQHPEQVPLDTSMANADRDRLDNLGIFSEVRWQAIPLTDSTLYLQYILIESWRYLPGFIPVYEEETGWSLNGGLIINNFRGRDEVFSIGGYVGGRNNLSIDYSNPWIAGDHISLDASIGNSSQVHLFLPYEEKNQWISIGVGRYFGYQYKTKAGLSLEQLRFVSSDDHSNLEFPTLRVSGDFQRDTRDVYADPTRGSHWSHSINAMLDLSGEMKHRLFYTQSFSLYHTLAGSRRPLVAAGNVMSYLTIGNQQAVFQEYLGGAYTVRGWSVPDNAMYADSTQSYRFGSQSLVGSVELRQTIIPKHASAWQNEIGLSIVAFADVGVIDSHIDDLLRQSPLISVGFGIRIPMPVLMYLRFDLGWAYRHGQYVSRNLAFAFGHKF